MLTIATIGIVLIALYLYAGHRTWVDMMSDEDPGCLLSQEQADGTLPGWVYHLFLVAWFPLLLAASVAKALQPPRTYP